MQTFLTRLRAQGVTVATPLCDIADESAVQAAVDETQEYMPPIKGCIQSAMVLEVRYHISSGNPSEETKRLARN